jgi:hypothetical protein
MAEILKNTLVCAVYRLYQDATLSAMLKVPLLMMHKSKLESTSLDFSDLAAVEQLTGKFQTKYVVFELD